MTDTTGFVRAPPVAALALGTLLLLGAVVEAGAQTRPSWCNSQPKLNAAEGAICASPTLWDIDARLGRAYRDTLRSAGPRRTELMRSQQGWLQARNACGATAPCLEAIYQDRLTSLSGFAGEVTEPPQQQVAAGSAPAAAAADTAPQIQRTTDGRSLLSFPVTPPRRTNSPTMSRPSISDRPKPWQRRQAAGQRRPLADRRHQFSGHQDQLRPSVRPAAERRPIRDQFLQCPGRQNAHGSMGGSGGLSRGGQRGLGPHSAAQRVRPCWAGQPFRRTQAQGCRRQGRHADNSAMRGIPVVPPNGEHP